VVFGFHAVLARLRADPASVIEIFLDETRNDARGRDLAAAASRAGVTLMRVPTKRLDGFYGGGRHQGVVARIEVKPLGHSLDELLEALSAPPRILVLDGVTDPHNLGACLRVANAAGAHAVVAPRDRAAGISAAVSKVASGAAEATPYIMVTNLARTLDELKERNIWIVGADERAERTLYQADLPDSIAWVLGAEGEGMRRLTRERCDLLVRIPMLGEVQSLNVSVAAGVVLFESVRRRGANRTDGGAGGPKSMAGKRDQYVPPDLTRIDAHDPRALSYWAGTLEIPEERLREALERAGPLLEDVKKELGIAGIG
jgi:23S rRNA (guanosine2251-2'-O)-methyltransferase